METEATQIVRTQTRAASLLSRIPWSKFGLPAATAVMFVFFSFASPYFFTLGNIQNVLRQGPALDGGQDHHRDKGERRKARLLHDGAARRLETLAVRESVRASSSGGGGSSPSPLSHERTPGRKSVERQVIHPKPPAADMPFVPAVTVKGDHTVIYAAGATASPLYHSHPHVEEELRVPDDIRAQTHMTFDNIRLVLGACGAALKDVVRATVYLTDRAEMDAMNEEYVRIFEGHLPARTCVIVNGLVAPNLKIEVEVTAIIPS